MALPAMSKVFWRNFWMGRSRDSEFVGFNEGLAGGKALAIRLGRT